MAKLNYRSTLRGEVCH